MSLAVLADHMASKGRGPDSMLIHMSPREVQGLQALAENHGGSLTINPETGLPEAGILDKLLPAIIGFALAPMTAGTSLAFLGATPMASALTVGGLQALRTGDIGKGIQAGLGAYGGAGLQAGLATAGTSAIGSEAARAGAGLTADMAANLADAGITDAGIQSLGNVEAANQALQQQAAERVAAASPMDKLSAGFDAAKANPSSLLTKDNFKYLAAGAAPILADQAVKSNLPTTATKPGSIRPYSYDPYGGTYTAGTPYEAMPTKAADGGLMGLAAGGIAGYGDGDDVPRRVDNGMAQGGMYEFAQRSEPVLRMAEGGGVIALAEGGGWDYSKFDPKNYVSTAKVATQAEVDAANAANPYSAQNMAKVDVTRPGQYVTDPATGNPVALTAGVAGFDPNNKIAQTYLGELAAKGGQDSTSQAFNQIATPEQKASAASLWTAEKARLDALDAAKGLTGLANLNQNQNLLVNQDQNKNLNAGLTNLIPADASYTNRFFAERGMGFDPIDKAIDNFFAEYSDDLALKTPQEQERLMRAALNTERMNEADVIKATGKTIAQLIQQKTGNIDTVLSSVLPGGVSGGGNTVVNANGTITTTPDIPGRPDGGFTGMKNLRDVYEEGGGSLGVNKNLFAPKTQDELFARYKNTGGSKAALDYLMGKTPYSPVPVTPTGEIMKPYWESVGRFPENRKAKKYVFVNGKYELNPDYVKPSYVLAGEKAAADKAAEEKTTKAGVASGKSINVIGAQGETEQATLRDDGFYYTSGGNKFDEKGTQVAAGGGLAALTMAGGGMSGQFDLGGYSDGGRLLRGPGDGVSDSIPATIGNKRPARLADGEFVVPARIVSELGNGSTEAGARKLYAMMDRVQKARRGTVGKGKVAKNSRSDKYLPA